jgi:hypothetical protein
VGGDVGEAAAGQRRLEARLQDEPVVAQHREDVAQPPKHTIRGLFYCKQLQAPKG